MLSRLRTVTAAELVPRHCGIHVAAASPMRRSPSSRAMPTSVLATDFVAEKTSCVVSGPVPRKYHSPASLPSRTTTRQFDLPCLACAAICASFAASSPTAAGGTFCQLAPGFAGVAAAADDAMDVASAAAPMATTRCSARRESVTTGMFSRCRNGEARKPSRDRIRHLACVPAQAVVALHDDDLPQRAGGRHAERVALALHDQHRDIRAFELAEPARRRRCSLATRRLQREGQAE